MRLVKGKKVPNNISIMNDRGDKLSQDKSTRHGTEAYTRGHGSLGPLPPGMTTTLNSTQLKRKH
jgi:hypothetical protein